MHGFSVLWDVLAGQQVMIAVQLALAGLLGWAGAYKLARPRPIAEALVNFGLSERSHPWLGRLVGLVEVLVAAGLMVPPSRRVAAVAAGVLAFCFTMLLARALLRGQEFSCACLGAGEPVSPAGVWRSGVMAAGAVLVAMTPGAAFDLAVWMQGATIATIVVGVPLLEATRRRLAAMQTSLEDGLDWDWVLQTVDAQALGRGWPWHRWGRARG